MKKIPPTADRIRTLFHYDPDTGIFTRRVAVAPGKAGDRVGTLHISGHLTVSVDCTTYTLHRLAWLYMTGLYPPSHLLIVFKNKDKTDIRWDNLESTTLSKSTKNKPKPKRKSKIVGATKLSNKNLKKPWSGSIKVNGKQLSLGTFETAEQAHAAYLFAREECDTAPVLENTKTYQNHLANSRIRASLTGVTLHARSVSMKDLRHRRGLTQRAVAKHANGVFGQQLLSIIEQGKIHSLSHKTLLCLMTIYNVDRKIILKALAVSILQERRIFKPWPSERFVMPNARCVAPSSF